MTEGGQSARSDIWGGAAWAGFGLLILAESLCMDRFEAMGAQLYTMPGFVPGLLGAVVVLFGLLLVARGWHRSRREPHGEEGAAPLFNARVGLTLALALVYAVLLIGRIPFWLATALFVAAFVALFTPPTRSTARRWVVALLAGVITSAVVSLVFQEVFLVRLP
ncbi:tripartite tricarboxylate transporter TctB family protein [Hydrogenophaga sp.]|uniref:tripartite tricarboxylate transporter TctB family protein n=1 Tax=Hydrogenophaga sp. TaxID=1904254 RepID=UPI0026267E5D|nr:tripartite tricarboxylate transporter TctB family protein [Hydrogenophaga sp.]MCW5652714.1 tripartite tricarboxylate transporter TctB family protein [Hydrogenophaga sp.]